MWSLEVRGGDFIVDFVRERSFKAEEPGSDW